MTVKNVTKLLKKAKEIRIAFAGLSLDFDPAEPFLMDAYGKYLVNEICAYQAGCFEIRIAEKPLREGDEWEW